MKRVIATMLAVVMTMSVSCFTSIVQANDTEKKLYIVRLSQAPVYEVGGDMELSLYSNGSSSASSREMKIQSEHKAFKTNVSKNTDSNIVYEYNQVFNGMAIEATAEEIEEIKNMSGVTGVYESGTHTVDEPESSTGESAEVYDLGDSINADELRDKMNELQANSGDGEGMVIAIVDTEFDVNHEAYSLTDNSSIKIHKKDLSSLLTGLSLGNMTANQVYQSEKIPFVYNYVNLNKDVTDYDGSVVHGTHVAGIAAGNSDTLKGIAPNAQLVLMKCSTDDGELEDAAMLAAINDAVKLKVDVINFSIGGDYANCNDDEPFMEAMRNVAASPTELFAAAGNSGLGINGSNKALTSEVSYDTGGNPAGSSDIVTVGNAYSDKLYDNCGVMKVYDAEGNELYDNCLYTNGNGSNFTGAFKDGKYEIIDVGLGEEADYEDIDVTGKVVMVRRGGTLDSIGKRKLIQSNGGIGMIYVMLDVRAGLYEVENFPASIVYADGYEKLKNAKYIQTTDETQKVSYAQQMNTSSSYCINEYLEGGVQLSARGTAVMSSVPDDKYELWNGTSMASPMAAGAYALVKSYLKNKYPDISSDTADFTTFCVNMMQNTADIVCNPNMEDNAPYTPRAQGAGFINLASLANSEVVLTDKESGKGMVYCGATEDNDVTFTLCLENFSDKAVTYNNISSVTVRDYVNEDGYIGYGSVKADSTFNMGSSVTVPANGKVEFPVTVSISSATRSKLDAIFENGFFLDGFVSFAGDDVQTISIPFTSFMGDYFKAPVFTGGNELYDAPCMMYYNDDVSEWRYVGYSEDNGRYVLSTNYECNEQVGSNLDTSVAMCLLRGTQAMLVTVRNSDGNIIYKRSEEGWSKYEYFTLSFGDAFDGEAEGDYSVTIEGVLNSDRTGATTDSISFDVHLDNTVPVIESVDYDEDTKTITVTASDNYDIGYAEAKDSDGNTNWASFEESDGVYTASIDASELGEDYDIYVYDSAYNYATTAEESVTEDGNYLVTEVSEYYSGSIFCKVITISNPSGKTTPITPILAIYDKDGKLLKTEVGETVRSFNRVRYTFKMKLTEPTFPDLKIPEGATIKLFLWDSVSDMHPVEFTITDGK